jgi:hypothetical protein
LPIASRTSRPASAGVADTAIDSMSFGAARQFAPAVFPPVAAEIGRSRDTFFVAAGASVRSPAPSGGVPPFPMTV